MGTRRRSDIYQERADCPVYTAIAVIDGRWKPMIYQRLLQRPHGFGELRRALPRVTIKVLREQLRQMQTDGLLVRRTLSPATRGVRYALTAHGRALQPVFQALWIWGTRHLARRRPPSAAATVARSINAAAETR